MIGEINDSFIRQPKIHKKEKFQVLITTARYHGHSAQNFAPGISKVVLDMFIAFLPLFFQRGGSVGVERGGAAVPSLGCHEPPRALIKHPNVSKERQD